MARTTATEVRAILGVDASETVTPFMETAGLIVDENLESRGLSVELLTKIEAYLSAHYFAITNPEFRIESEKIGESMTSFSGKTGTMTGFMATQFGQVAIQLDKTGVLKKLGLPAVKIKTFSTTSRRRGGRY